MTVAGHELALACLTLLDTPPPEAVAAAANAGFDSVTLRLIDDPPPDGGQLSRNGKLLQETSTNLAALGVTVLDVEVVRLRAELQVTALRPDFELASRLGARYVVALGDDQDESRLTERFAELCEETASFGLRAMIEFAAFTTVETLEKADKLVERAGQYAPEGGVLVDPLHLQRSGGSPSDLARLVKLNPSRYPYAQLCDAPLSAPSGGDAELLAEARNNRRAPGDGELSLKELVRTLPSEVPLSVEAPVLHGANRTAAERAQTMMQATRRLLDA
jgi:sugar phosphate isomerase/epimerase